MTDDTAGRAWRPNPQPGHGGGDRASFVRLLALTAVLLAAMTALVGPRFLSIATFQSIAFQLPELALLSFAMLLSMLTGGIDLSIVSIANLSGVVAAMTMVRWLPDHANVGSQVVASGIGAAAGLVTALACGAINGAVIAFVRVPPILATLGTLQLFTGLALVFTGGRAIVGLPDVVPWMGNGTFVGLPVPLWLLVVASGAMAVVVNDTVFGVEARLIGSSAVAARYAGIPVRSVLVRVYLSTAAIAGVTGLLMVSRANSAKADYGSSYLLQSILVAVLGGVRPAGGSGRVLGVVLAGVALQVLSAGFGMLRLTTFATELAWGAFLLLVMVVNRWSERRE
jgi:simple sugar transport system permease protein